MLDHFLNGILPIFAVGALGFVFGKRGAFDFDRAMAINKFVMFVAMPALGFRLLARAPVEQFDLAMLGGYLSTEIVMYLGGFVIARYVFRTDIKEAALIGLTLTLTNHVLFVLPIASTLFGEESITPIVAIISMDSILVFSGTIILMEVLATKNGSLREAMGKISRNPPVIAMVLGLSFGATDLVLPKGFDVFLKFLGDAAAPALLFALGVILSQTQKSTRPTLPLAITGIKLIVHPLLAWGIFAGLLNLTPEVQMPALLVAAAPCGMMAFMLALNYGVRVDAIARAILYTSIGSLITLTFVAGL